MKRNTLLRTVQQVLYTEKIIKYKITINLMIPLYNVRIKKTHCSSYLIYEINIKMFSSYFRSVQMEALNI